MEKKKRKRKLNEEEIRERLEKREKRDAVVLDRNFQEFLVEADCNKLEKQIKEEDKIISLSERRLVVENPPCSELDKERIRLRIVEAQRRKHKMKNLLDVLRRREKHE